MLRKILIFTLKNCFAIFYVLFLMANFMSMLSSSIKRIKMKDNKLISPQIIGGKSMLIYITDFIRGRN
jgi:hypothetical protein